VKLQSSMDDKTAKSEIKVDSDSDDSGTVGSGSLLAQHNGEYAKVDSNSI